ncbi:MAG: hypothetical protein HY869_20005 [Chloroflexi bacterium]|nr:hypothetical protein [Chloroflexota bacterium]
MTPPRSPIIAFLLVLCLVSLACEPVFVVGWQEVTLILLLAVFLVGPLVYRLLRAWIKFQDALKKKK